MVVCKHCSTSTDFAVDVCRLESVWTVPTLDDDGNVVFPLGAYFKSVLGAQRFYDLVNLRPQTIFSSSAGLYVSSPTPYPSPLPPPPHLAPPSVLPAPDGTQLHVRWSFK